MGSDDTKHENEARARTSALTGALLRINASLDHDTVLRQAVDAARALTSARYGIIVTLDEAGEVGDFVTSNFPDDERRRFIEWPDRPRFSDHLRQLPGPLRLDDWTDYVRSLGLEVEHLPACTFMSAPMRHRDAHVGHFFLGDKAGAQPFTDADEAVLALFAAQAASAIANARAHRDEQRARADLEAVVETSPVGVLVFDAKSGRVVSFNREARRVVEGLGMPGRRLEELLEAVVCRRADGREASLAELPLGRRPGAGETLRGEEAVLFVPDGPSVRTLINATPIPAEDGTAASVVVTLQDLAPLDEIERLRTEFLSLVSHELRTPLAAIMGSVATVLDASQTLDPAELREFLRVIDEQARLMRGLIGDLLDAGRIDAGTLSVSPEPAAVGDLVEQARSAFLGAGGRHAVALDLPSGLPPVMADRRRVAQVLGNLLANAARHAPASSPIRVAASRQGAHVALAVSDEGRGVPPEVLPRLFSKHGGAGKGGSTAGYGLGLAICKGLVEAHGGRIRAESPGAGLGLTITFTLPAAAETGATSAGRPAAPQAGKPVRILAVDDDPRMLRLVRDALSAAGFAPLVTGEPQDLAAIIRRERPRLVLLDLALPGADGIELMGSVPELADLPVIFISAYGRDDTVARALEAGAADYVVKPFSPTELVARVRAALRRHDEPAPFVLGELAIDYERRRVTVAGNPVPLTVTEYELLRLLALAAGRVVTYDTLLRRLWSGRPHAESNPVRAFVRSLRRKLGDDAAHPAYVLNERGVGYRMPRPDEE